MTLADIMAAAYQWADARDEALLLAALGIPVVGTALAWIGKGGRTDRDGRFVASALVGIGLVVFVLEVVALVVARAAFDQSVLGINVVLLLAPLLCLAGCLLGARLVFPLTELGSVRTCMDVGMFAGACLVVVWLFSMFRGWGIVFLGGLTELLVVGVLGFVLLRRLYRRAFGRRRY